MGLNVTERDLSVGYREKENVLTTSRRMNHSKQLNLICNKQADTELNQTQI